MLVERGQQVQQGLISKLVDLHILDVQGVIDSGRCINLVLLQGRFIVPLVGVDFALHCLDAEVHLGLLNRLVFLQLFHFFLLLVFDLLDFKFPLPNQPLNFEAVSLAHICLFLNLPLEFFSQIVLDSFRLIELHFLRHLQIGSNFVLGHLLGPI